MPDDLTVRLLGHGDVDRVIKAAELFDNPPRHEWIETFLSLPTHHLLFAFREDRAVGFITGVEMTHPDKGTEMFVYELAVAADQRRMGVAKAMLAELTAIARARACYGMWVLTDDDNLAALSAYRSAGATSESEHVMLTWDWTAADSPRSKAP